MNLMSNGILSVFPINDFKIYDYSYDLSIENKCDNLANIYVDNNDPFNTFLNFDKNYYNPVVCIPFNYNKSNNFDYSALFFKTLLRSNLYSYINNYNFDSGYFSCFHIDNLLIFRDSNLSLNSCFTCPIIINNFIHIDNLEDNLLSDDDYKIISVQIDNLFQSAYKNNHDIIIFNDFDPNFFNIPVYQLIEIFNDLIDKWKFYFKKIIFSIPSNEKYLYLYNINYDKSFNVIFSNSLTQ